MNRLEELTQKRIDGTLSRAEEQALERLLEEDPEALRHHGQLLEIESALRSLDEHFDVSEQVMATIAPIGGSVRPARVGPERFGDWWWLSRVAIPLAAAAGVALAFVVMHQERLAKDSPSTVQTRQRARGDGIQVVRSGVSQPVIPSLALAEGDRLVAPAGTDARVRYEDNTEVRLAAGTELIFEPTFTAPETASKRLRLVTGSLRAEVPKQTAGAFLLQSDQALAIVRGTIFRLSAEPGQTRLTVDRGRVDLVRSKGGGKVSVDAGHFALAGKDGKLISRPQRVRTGLELYYTFEEGNGAWPRDRSGATDGLDLQAVGSQAGPPGWSPSGLRIPAGAVLSNTVSTTRVIDSIRYTKTLTLEAWIALKPQERPAEIVSLSAPGNQPVLVLSTGQAKDPSDVYTVRLSTSKDGDGIPLNAPRRSVTGKLTQIVFVRESNGAATLYLDGKRVASRRMDGDFSKWPRESKIILGECRGQYRLIALYSRPLTAKEVLRNHESGPDQRGDGFP